MGKLTEISKNQTLQLHAQLHTKNIVLPNGFGTNEVREILAVKYTFYGTQETYKINKNINVQAMKIYSVYAGKLLPAFHLEHQHFPTFCSISSRFQKYSVFHE